MTDGPFKNVGLGICWRRFEEAIQNEAASPAERVALASDALIRSLITAEHTKLLRELREHADCGQFDFDPPESVNEIFDRYERTAFLDQLQKQLQFRIGSGMPLWDGITPALDATLNREIREVRNRFQEECIHAQEVGDLSRSAAARVNENIDATFDSVDSEKVRNALLGGRKDAFEAELGRNNSVDAGLICL